MHLIPLNRVKVKFTTMGKESNRSFHTLYDNHQKWP